MSFKFRINLIVFYMSNVKNIPIKIILYFVSSVKKAWKNEIRNFQL